MTPDAIRARIFLHGVLAQIPALCAGDAESREMVRGWRTSIQFAQAGGPAALLRFRDGAVSFEPVRRTAPGLSLWFPSDRALVRSFTGNGVPIPLFGVWRVGLLRALPTLTGRLSHYLSLSEPEPGDRNGEALTLALRMRLDALVRAVAVLASVDSRARRTLREAPDGTIALRAPGMADVAARKRGDRLTIEPEPDAAPNLTLGFASVACGHDLLAGRLEPAAAIGLGSIELRGQTLLADAVFQVVGDVQMLLAG